MSAPPPPVRRGAASLVSCGGSAQLSLDNARATIRGDDDQVTLRLRGDARRASSLPPIQLTRADRRPAVVVLLVVSEPVVCAGRSSSVLRNRRSCQGARPQLADPDVGVGGREGRVRTARSPGPAARPSTTIAQSSELAPPVISHRRADRRGPRNGEWAHRPSRAAPRRVGVVFDLERAPSDEPRESARPAPCHSSLAATPVTTGDDQAPAVAAVIAACAGSVARAAADVGVQRIACESGPLPRAPTFARIAFQCDVREVQERLERDERAQQRRIAVVGQSPEHRRAVD